MGINAYRKIIRENEAPRNMERRVLSSITGTLEKFDEAYDASESLEERLAILSGGLREALAENLKFWTILKYDLLGEGNGLPKELRASIVSLAIWMERQTSAVLGGEPGVIAIVDINRSILAGLSGHVEAEA